MSREIILAGRSLPEPWVTVLHGPVDQNRHVGLPDSDGSDKVVLSTELVKWDSMGHIVSSSDIGLVLYTDSNLNEYNTGMSSEKMARHMQCGTPVIASDFPSFQRIIDRYGCGLCVSNPTQIRDAVKKIESDYEAFRNNAFRCYEENYEFTRHFNEVINFIEMLS